MIRLPLGRLRLSVARRAAGLLVCIFAALFLLVGAADAQDKGTKKAGKIDLAKEKKLNLQDQLTPDLPTYKGRADCYYKAYDYPMKAGLTYTIDLMRVEGGGGLGDPYLYLEDFRGEQVAADDDSGGNLNARIVYRAPQTGTYRIIATSFRQRATGAYVLSARPGGTAVPVGGMAGMPSIPAPLAVEQTYGDITITGEPRPVSVMNFGGNNEFGHGYVEHRFSVHNDSTTDTHQVTIKLANQYSYVPGPFLGSLSRTVDVGPGATATVALPQPDLALSYGGPGSTQVTIDGRLQKAPLGGNPGTSRGQRYLRNYGHTELMLNVLAGEQLGFPLNNNVFKMAVDRPGPPLPMGPFGGRTGVYNGRMYTYPQMHRFQQALGPVSAWSANWLGYSSYDGIVVQADEVNAAPPEVRQALWRYVECGGSLVVLGNAKLPAGWRRNTDKEDELAHYYPGFGECLVAATPKDGQILPGPQFVERWTPKDWQRITDAWDNSVAPWRQLHSVTRANDDFPVVDNLGIPISGLFVLMLLFAIAIGPVNVYLLSRWQRRIWLLWTVPVISFVTCLAVLGYMVVSEGWQSYRRTATLTVLDEGSRRASTVGWVGFYTPLAPSDGLHFSPETELTPQIVPEPTGPSRRGTPRTLDWTEEQHLQSGWITARVPAHFLVRKSETRRERLAVHREKDGALAVSNLLGADIEQLWLADHDGKVYTAANVPAGGKATLAPSDRTAGGGPDALRQLYKQDWLQHYQKLTGRPHDYLRPGCYLAALAGTPFLEEGMRGARPRQSRAVVYGILAESRRE